MTSPGAAKQLLQGDRVKCRVKALASAFAIPKPPKVGKIIAQCL